MVTIEQQIAQAQAVVARLQDKKRSLDTGQKIILGGMLLAAARHDAKIAAWLIKEAEKSVTRDIDKKRLAPLLDELETLAAAPSSAASRSGPTPPPSNATP